MVVVRDWSSIYGVEKLLSLKSKPAMSSKFSTPVPGLTQNFSALRHNTIHPSLREYNHLLKDFFAANIFSDGPTSLHLFSTPS